MKSLKFLPVLLLTVTILLFFYPVSLNGKVPIPADTIIGLYNPFRDFYAKDYPNGIPFKNSLITDPVRQQFPWRFYATLMEQYQTLPLWNPFNSAGTPLLANFQAAVFYPLNLLLFLPDFTKWWSVLIILQPVLGGIFMYLFLKQQKLNIYSSLLGGFTYAFCGFSIAWLEWGTIGHVALWLPLILLSIDKILVRNKNQELRIKTRSNIIWSLIFIFSITSAFFAGHLQTFFYLYLLTLVYFFGRWFQYGKKKKLFLIFLFLNFCFLILTSIQWLPTLQLVLLSARDVDQIAFQTEGWFLPVQNLAQFFAPDFFGNPATLNYWGVWNYGEFIAYIGILPLILACFALFYRYDKKTFFFGSIFFLSLIFALPTWFAKLPFILHIPFVDTTQPTRLLFLTDFSLSVLAAFGLDYFMHIQHKCKIFFPVLFLFLVYSFLWIFVYIPPHLYSLTSMQNLDIARHNLYFPTVIFIIISLTFLIYIMAKNKKIQTLLILLLLAITVFDLFRFGSKFTPFTNREYLYPNTASLYAVRKLSDLSRVMTTDSRILPPNFTIMYFTQSIDGYDPLYLRRYGELIAAMERNEPNINPPFGFNRIITPHNYNSKIADLLGVKFVLSLNELNSPKLKQVYNEGQTRVYVNRNAFDRTFFVNDIHASSNKQESINSMFDLNIDLKHTAIVENWDMNNYKFNNTDGKADISVYKSNEVTIKTTNHQEGFLVLTDSFYPTWHAKICSKDYNNCKETKIYLTDYNFRGVRVPAGSNVVIFYNKLF